MVRVADFTSNGRNGDAGAPTVADHLLARLVEAGVRHVFGVPGDYNLGLLDVIEAHPDLEWVGNANELNAAYAADGYARTHGLAAVVTTYGVGELSAMNGIAGSFAECVPVLMIAGTPATHVQELGLPVHHGLLDGDPGHFARAFGPLTCASARLCADTAAREIDRVLGRVLADKRPGYIALPCDLVAARAVLPGSEPAAVEAESSTVVAAERGFAERAQAMLAGASAVVVLADHLADRHGVQRHLDCLIALGSLKSATTAAARSLIDETTPGFLGLYIGALSDPAVRDAVETADVVIGVGLRLVDLTSGGFTARLDPDRLIDLQPHHAVAGRESFPGVGMAAALIALTNIVADRPAPAASFFEPHGMAHCTDRPEPDGRLTQATFWQRIGGFLRPGDIIAADQGTPLYGLLGLRLPSGVDVIAQPLWASIGYALPAIIGAQLAAEPGRRGVLLIGDGSFQMTAQELGTMARHATHSVVFLLNNEGYTVERAINGWTAGYNEIPRWDWSRVPGALGAAPDSVIARAGTPAELDAALAACQRLAGGLAFVEVVLDRHDMPPLLTELANAIATQNDAASRS
jgi:indolepyruvate decarboxylase